MQTWHRHPTLLRWSGSLITSGIGVGCVRMNPSRSGLSLAWRHPWLLNIIAELILDRNPGGTLTNYNINLADLVIHEDTLLDVCPEANMGAP